VGRQDRQDWQLVPTPVPVIAPHYLLALLLLLLIWLQDSQALADAAPPTAAERRRFYPRTTSEALKSVRDHQHKGAHPYRVVLGEVSG
jgi:hypothetical protein